MSLNLFIPSLWAARLQKNLRNTLVYGQPGVVNREYEGQIQAMGSSVRINAIGTITVGDYTKNTNIGDPQELTDASTMLVIERSRYFNFQVDDVDAIQQQPKVMDEAMEEAAFALSNDADGYIAGKHTEVGDSTGSGNSQNIIGGDTSPITIGTGAGETNAYEQLVNVGVAMDEANVPLNGRWIVVPPWFYGMLLKDQRFVSFGTPENRAALANRAVGEVSGLTVYRSNNVPNTSGTKYKLLASYPGAISFAAQANQVEAYRPQQRFADAVKGLLLYGAKITRPHAVILVTANKGT